MDFGFSGLVEKFEEYFGRNMTRIILACVGFVAVATALRVAYDLVIGPVINLVLDQTTAENLFFLGLQLIASFAVVVIASTIGRYIFSGFFKVDRYRAKVRLLRIELARAKRKVGDSRREIDEMKQELASSQEETNATFQEARQLLARLEAENEKLEG